ncbi:uncharacterized protein N7483_000868 [Penicillium malachiteum]|uniref:uncharacterized protein n=1 Tax=Penicillium malachiteum TaxID=1324776 RepID=UPI002548F289|nr:uncharacterized protein N7483_000868 [Penicillium malachiteum]KAJ5735743.1 hypothetical protein N7483_000868 [Penicillium malachiteum]
MNSAVKGEKALAESNAPLAIQHFTRALSELPRAPTYYIQRSIAYSRLKPVDGGPNPAAALQDAETALLLARERGKRELILFAQMRRGIAFFHLERYGDAHYLFERIGAMIGGGNTSGNKSEDVQNAMKNSATKKDGYSAEHPIWMMKASKKLGELPEGDEKKLVSVLEYPTDTKVPTEKELKAEWERLKSGQSAVAASKKPETAAQPAPGGAASSSGDAKLEQKPVENLSAPIPEKVRHEWYQSQDSVVVTLYVKNVPKDKVQSEIKDNSVSIQLPLPSGSEYDFTLDPLYAPINTSSSKITVMGTKIEIVLQKQVPGQKWSALEAPADSTKLTDRPVAPTTAAAPASSGPAYPTSSRHGAKDWDKVASSLEKPKPKGESGDGNESDGSDVEGDAVDSFFKKLYAGADPDTRRAMMKSYVESNGTSLSTNWDEVGTKKVEPHSSD